MLVKFVKTDGIWKETQRKTAKDVPNYEVTAFKKDINRPLECWVKEGKVLLVMSRMCLIFDYDDIKKEP